VMFEPLEKRARDGLLRAAVALTLGLVAASGCGGGGDDDDGGVETTLFPASYDATYVEVRDCRRSADHDLNYIRVMADPDAVGPYADRDAPFPEGAVVLKEEYDPGDQSCSDEIVQWTVMRKLAAASAEEMLDWEWQQVDADRNVDTENELRCYNCHTECGGEPFGYDGTCAMP
jgi:Cytochrome P460